MKVTLVFTPVDGQDAAARLTALLTTLGVTMDAAAPAVIALLTPAALSDPAVLLRLRGAGKPPLLLAAAAPASFPTPADLARIIEWLDAPAPSAPGQGSKYYVVNAVNSTIGDNGITINHFGHAAGWSAAETASLVHALRGQPAGAAMSAQELRSLLAALQAQVQQVDMTLRAGFSATLARFDLSEQRIVGPILARLDAQHAAEVAALLDVLDAAAWTHDELASWLAPVSAALLEARSRAALPIEVNQTAELIEAPGLDVKHKLKLSIPLIPFLLDYESELEFDVRANLESAWQALRRLISRR